MFYNYLMNWKIDIYHKVWWVWLYKLIFSQWEKCYSDPFRLSLSWIFLTLEQITVVEDPDARAGVCPLSPYRIKIKIQFVDQLNKWKDIPAQSIIGSLFRTGFKYIPGDNTDSQTSPSSSFKWLQKFWTCQTAVVHRPCAQDFGWCSLDRSHSSRG